MAQPNYTGSSTHRTFETRADRHANQNVAQGGQRQRSYSLRHFYDNGSVVREHIHDNARTSGEQFSHVIGGFNSDGSRWGRNDPWNG
jgi:hypothetical protein